ncbi:UDP-D-apiose/UDP-D-xylose synthase 1 [Hibiscus syriacus]|uniref:UDP-D-apiose/UDP-D-xylose synthase 1 n=1 Tax=Hibiscus syriacus TaxID=106335 RepID=A0A6A2YI66_HIBSY|nr:UDP-D-apiose/UDP-D-xylose synthase 1 [Hibiscus syriacus]
MRMLRRGRSLGGHGWSCQKLLECRGTTGLLSISYWMEGGHLLLLETAEILLWWNCRRGGTTGVLLEAAGTDPAYYVLNEDTSPCIFGSIEKQRWSYACAKQLIERLIYAEGAENGLEFTLENPDRANGHIFNVGNPNKEVTVRQLAEMMTKVYAKVSGESSLESPTVDVSSKEFYGDGYDDSDKRIPDMTVINKQHGWNPKTSLWDLLESTLTYQHRTYAEAIE